jgi:mono/diheme cytochrome c family protein
MVIFGKLILAISLIFSITTTALAENELNVKRGELLYTTHCDACHTSAMHWREEKLAKDWKSLKAQVVRWQTIAKASWDAQDIENVTQYLNNRFYHYQNTESKAVTEVIN